MKYEIIYADPAWHFTTWSRKAWRSVYHKYSTATVAEMAEIPVESIAADNSVLFMWVTDPCLPQAFELGAAWGFTYKTVAFTWVKQNRKSPGYFTGMGYYTRANPEMCLLFTRGKPLERCSKSVRQLVVEPIREHSRKPDTVRERIVELFGDRPRCELFAREHVEGWDCFGNELDGVDLKTKLGNYLESFTL